MKRQIKKNIFLSSFLALSLTACASSPTSSPAAVSTLPLSSTASAPNTVLAQSGQQAVAPKMHKVEFKLKLNTPDFQVAAANCSCKAKYAKLEIKGAIEQPISNGFVPIDPQTNEVTLSALVPEGHNWVAYAGLYANNDDGQPSLMEVGGVFHTPTLEQVEISLRTLQTAHIVDALHRIGSNRILSPLDLQEIQQFTDALVGLEWTENGSYKMNRFPGLLEGDVNILDADAIVALLEANGFDINAQTGNLIGDEHAENMVLQPKVVHSSRVKSFTAGLTKPVLNPFNNLLFSFDRETDSQNNVYRLDTTDILNAAANSAQQAQTPWLNTNMPHLTLGWYNDPQKTELDPVVYAYRPNGNNMSLEAYYQNDLSQAWSFQKLSSSRVFSPVSWRDTKNTPDPNDDEDIVYISVWHPTNASRGIYAVRNGQQEWHLPLADELTYSAALSEDGKRLYVLSMKNLSNVELIAVATTVDPEYDEPAVLWRRPLDIGVAPSNSPVVGSDGTIYVNSADIVNVQVGIPTPGFLHAIAPDGNERWRLAMPVASFFPPSIDHRNGEDVVYSLGRSGRIYSVGQSGQVKWEYSLPGTAGEGATGGILIGEDLGGGRTLYAPMGNGLIYAVRDFGTNYEMLWAKSPEAKVKHGLLLKDGIIYGTTLDGGEGQLVQLKAIQVHSQNMPAAAPWPTESGNLLGTGVSHKVFQNQNF